MFIQKVNMHHHKMFTWTKIPYILRWQLDSVSLHQMINSDFMLKWKRGDSKGATDTIKPDANNTLIFKSEFEIKCTIFVNKADGSIRPKKIFIKLKRFVKPGHAKIYGKLVIDVGQFYGMNEPMKISRDMESGRSIAPTLNSTFSLYQVGDSVAVGRGDLSDSTFVDGNNDKRVPLNSWDITEIEAPEEPIYPGDKISHLKKKKKHKNKDKKKNRKSKSEEKEDAEKDDENHSKKKKKHQKKSQKDKLNEDETKKDKKKKRKKKESKSSENKDEEGKEKHKKKEISDDEVPLSSNKNENSEEENERTRIEKEEEEKKRIQEEEQKLREVEEQKRKEEEEQKRKEEEEQKRKEEEEEQRRKEEEEEQRRKEEEEQKRKEEEEQRRKEEEEEQRRKEEEEEQRRKEEEEQKRKEEEEQRRKEEEEEQKRKEEEEEEQRRKEEEEEQRRKEEEEQKRIEEEIKEREKLEEEKHKKEEEEKSNLVINLHITEKTQESNNGDEDEIDFIEGYDDVSSYESSYSEEEEEGQSINGGPVEYQMPSLEDESMMELSVEYFFHVVLTYKWPPMKNPPLLSGDITFPTPVLPIFAAVLHSKLLTDDKSVEDHYDSAFNVFMEEYPNIPYTHSERFMTTLILILLSSHCAIKYNFNPQKAAVFISQLQIIFEKQLMKILQPAFNRSEMLVNRFSTATFEFDYLLSDFKDVMAMNRNSFKYGQLINTYVMNWFLLFFEYNLLNKIIQCKTIFSFSNAMQWNSFLSAFESDEKVTMKRLREVISALVMAQSISQNPELRDEICPNLPPYLILYFIANYSKDSNIKHALKTSAYMKKYKIKAIPQKYDPLPPPNSFGLMQLMKNLYLNSWNKCSEDEECLTIYKYLKLHIESP